MSTKKKKKKNTHDCNEKRKEFDNCAKSIIDMKFEGGDSIDKILEFYLFHALTNNSDNAEAERPSDKFGFKKLKDYGWGGKNLPALERELLKTSQIESFCFIKANSIKETLKAMNLDGRICFKHPRAVMKQDFSVSVQENGKAKITQTETRLQCLFRHIRNSLAHNRTYLLDEDMILFEDADGKKITARILMPKVALLTWIEVIKAGPCE
jgi:hypothetical protein